VNRVPAILTMERVIAAATPELGRVKYDAFLSHSWGPGGVNHNFVGKVDDGLRREGIVTWFDKSQMDKNVMTDIARGIDQSEVIVIFITQDYMDKVNADEPNACRYEFTYAAQTKPKALIPVVRDEELLSTKNWKGVMGAQLMSSVDFYIDMTSEKKLKEELPNLVKRINKVKTENNHQKR